MPITRRASIGAIAALLPCLAAPHVARAVPRPIRLGYNTPQTSHYGQGAGAFIDAVHQDPALAGVLRIEAYGNAELGDEIGLVRACLNSTLALLICSSSGSSSLVPAHGPLNAPYIFRDAAHARAVMDGPIVAELQAAERIVGLNVIAWGENGMRHVTANRPIASLADFQGLRIRVPPSDIIEGGLRAIGADPGQLKFTMLREALRTGEFDAQENAIILIESLKLYELHSCVSLTGHVYDPAFFAASSDLLDDLDARQASALRACAAIGAAKTREVAEAAERDGLARLRSVGMRVITNVQTGEMRNAARPYLASMAATHRAALPSLFEAFP